MTIFFRYAFVTLLGFFSVYCQANTKEAFILKSRHLHTPGDTLSIMREKAHGLLQEAATQYARAPEKTMKEITNPSGYYSNLSEGGDAFVAYIDPHGTHLNPAWKNAQKHPLSLLAGPIDGSGSQPTSTKHYGQLLLDSMTEMAPGETHMIVVTANKRPSTNRPAQAVVFLHKNQDGSLLYSPYYTLDLLHLTKHPITQHLDG